MVFMEQRKYPFLERKGFTITSSTSGGYLPQDYIVILESPHFSLKYGLERFTAFIEIASNTDKNEWKDLTLVKALLYSEELSEHKPDTAKLEHFLQTDFDKIVLLFNNENYAATKIKLNELVRVRLRRMFPKLKDRF